MLVAVSYVSVKCSAIYYCSSFFFFFTEMCLCLLKKTNRKSVFTMQEKNLSANSTQTLWPICFIYFCWKEPKLLFLHSLCIPLHIGKTSVNS